MSEFRWHKMSDEVPEGGMRDYLVMGPKGGLRIAHGYRGGDGTSGGYFHEYKTGHGFIDPKDVYAWAEIPMPWGTDRCSWM